MFLLTIDLETGKYNAVPSDSIYTSLTHREFRVTDASTEWNIAHNLNTNKLILSAHLADGTLIASTNYQIIDANNLRIKNLPAGSTGSVKIISEF